MSNDIEITPELRSAGYIGKLGLTFMCIFMALFGALIGVIFFGIILSMWLGNSWGDWPWLIGGILGALVGVGMAVQKVESDNLKARALVNAANWGKR